jgi:hypothetical protein
MKGPSCGRRPEDQVAAVTRIDSGRGLSMPGVLLRLCWVVNNFRKSFGDLSWLRISRESTDFWPRPARPTEFGAADGSLSRMIRSGLRARVSESFGNVWTACSVPGPPAAAEYLGWPSDLLYPLPDTLTDADGAMLEPLGVAIHAASLGHLHLGESAVVAGCGPIGLLLIQVLRAAGAAWVAAFDPLPHRREAASRAEGVNLARRPRTASVLGRKSFARLSAGGPG